MTGRAVAIQSTSRSLLPPSTVEVLPIMVRLHIRCAVLSVVVLSAIACGKDPEIAKAEYLRSGDSYFTQQKYKEAALEYRNAIQQDPRFGEARLKLAETYVKLLDA